MEFLRYVPKSYLSWFVGRLVHTKLPGPLAALSVKVFTKMYGIDHSIAARSLESYPTIGEFFVRDLRDGVRPIAEEFACPVDGKLRSCGDVPPDGELVQTKGRTYSLERLLDSDELADRFRDGQVWNFYLSPKDAHHIFSPVDGRIVKTVHIPGALWPVNNWAIENVDGLFAANERLVSYIESPYGLVAVVMVGATNVGRIKLSYADLETNVRPWKKSVRSVIRHDRPIEVSRGAKLGTFLMGSSVVLLTERKMVDCTGIAGEREVKYGEDLKAFASKLSPDVSLSPRPESPSPGS